MSEPLITTVIPTYKRPAMLRRAIRSVLSQTFPDYRVCVYDNASDDQTAMVVEEFQKKDPRVEYICRPTNIGAHANFVDGANRVGTPFFSFLSDDDIMLPNFFHSALMGFRRHPEAALSTLTTVRMSPKGKFVNAPVLRWPVGLIAPPDGVFSILLRGDPGLQALLIRREIWERFDGFDETTEPSGDLDFQLRVTACFPIVVSAEVGAIGIMHGESTTVSTEFKTVWPGWRRIFDKFSQDPNLPPSVRERGSAILTRWMKRGLVTQGVMRYISREKWNEAEWAADQLVEQCGQARAARMIRGVTTLCRRLPGSAPLLRALFEMRIAEKAMRNLIVERRFRFYSRLLKDLAV